MLLVAPPLTWLAARTAARAASPCGCVDPRSLRPPLDYTSQFAKDSGPIEVTPIGWISSPYKERFGTPRQPTVNEQVSGGKLQEGEIVLAPDVSTLALRGRMPHRLEPRTSKLRAATHSPLATALQLLTRSPRLGQLRASSTAGSSATCTSTPGGGR